MNIKITLVAAVIGVVGCASVPGSAELDAQAVAMMKASFRDQGIAKVDRLDQDLGQKACSSDKPPSNGQYLGDWREGEKLAQSGRGMTWTDASAATSANGGNCYNCHQISKAEISYGTIGPSLYNYGKLRGVKDPADPSSSAMLQYTWAKLWNSKAFAACSNMPRFGHARLLDETQLQHIMALLLDPKSPVNE